MAKDPLLESLSKSKREAPADVAKDKNFVAQSAALQKAIEAADKTYFTQLKTFIKTVEGLQKSMKGKKDAEKYLADLGKMLKTDEDTRTKGIKEGGTSPG